jgi:hypothetical protein
MHRVVRGAAMPQDVTDLETPVVSAQEVQAELETVLRSAGFERSERLQNFLRYICDLTVRGESHRINEYLIGSQVFRKGADYNPNEDSVVRRQAHTLRQKLQDYYANEGREDAIRIELPVGRYVPVFRRQERPKSPEPQSAAVAVPLAAPPVRVARVYVLAAAGLAVLALAAGILIGRRAATSPAQNAAWNPGPATKEIWSAWLQTPSEVVVCFSNPITAVLKLFDKPQPPDVLPRRFRLPPTEEQIFRERFKLPPGGYLYFSPAVSQAKMGEAFAAAYLAAFFGSAGIRVTPSQSRFLTWEQVRRESIILLGHNEANQWVDPLLKDCPLRLTATSGRQQRAIVNVSPRPGEPAQYKISYSEDEFDADQEYALVSMLRGFERDRQVLLVSGLNTQATQIATEYMTREETLATLLAKLRAERPNHQGRWRFQAILKTEVYDKVPTRASLVTVRVLD